MKVLVLGGVRSGKSRYAESLAASSGGPVTVIATGFAGDGEMAARIAAHRAKRPHSWAVVEEPVHLARALEECAAAGSVIIVECLTLWLTNLLCNPRDDMLDAEVESLFDVLPRLPGTVLFVGNEVGLGIMPVNDLARRFGDVAGVVHQRLASLCGRVIFMVAGLPLAVKEAAGGELAGKQPVS